MLAVSNPSPFRYMIAVGRVIPIPPGMSDALPDKGAPQVREWITQPPAWLRIHPFQSAADAKRLAVPGVPGGSYQLLLIGDPLTIPADMRGQGFRINAALEPCPRVRP